MNPMDILGKYKKIATVLAILGLIYPVISNLFPEYSKYYLAISGVITAVMVYLQQKEMKKVQDTMTGQFPFGNSNQQNTGGNPLDEAIRNAGNNKGGFINSILGSDANPFDKILRQDSMEGTLGNIEQVFGGKGNFQGYASEGTVEDFLKRAKALTQQKDIPNGIPAMATVIFAQQDKMRVMTGNGSIDNCKMLIQVQVTDQNGQSWETVLEDMIPKTQVGFFQPGNQFAVKYDPNNKMNICLDTQN